MGYEGCVNPSVREMVAARANSADSIPGRNNSMSVRPVRAALGSMLDRSEYM